MSMIQQNGRLPDEQWMEPEAPASADGAPANPLLKVHQLLRGKYLWGAILGVVFATAGAAVAYKLPALKPKYTSVGMVSVRPVAETLIYEITSKTPVDVDAFLDSQLPVLKTQRLLDRAMSLKKDQLA